jgi:aryl-alcohol dehydrogenase-like predicted oxidoreductase
VLRAGEIFGWLRQAESEGLIQRFGASVETVEEGMICLEQEGLLSLQIIFNLFRQKPAEKLFPRAREQGVGIIVRLPLASGLLSGKFDTGTSFHESDHRNYNCDGQHFNVGETFAGLPFAQGAELAGRLKSLVPAGMTMAQMSLRWILDHDEVSVVIPGASSPQQVGENAAASALAPLPAELHEKLADFYRSEVRPYIRGGY